MYCSNCHQRVYYKDLSNQGWCEHCQHIVRVSQCSTSYWFIAAAFIALWSVQPGL
jgi:acetyl-CoA carboxylase beta subunit